MGAKSRRARRLRTRSEFDLPRLAHAIAPPIGASGIFGWSLEDIFAARSQQMLGRFRLPARAAEAMRTDDALAVAYENRLAPLRCLGVEIVPARGARGEAISGEAESLFGAQGVSVHPDTLADINGCLANHGVAFATGRWVARADGSRVDVFVSSWPIEYVRWDPVERAFKTQVEAGGEETIVHGDGRWAIFTKHELEPWKQEAALLSGLLVWARHAHGVRDWALGSRAHGNAKVLGEMPQGVALQDAEGKLTPEGQAFIDLLRGLATGDAAAGIQPAGSKVSYLANSSTAWEVWRELVLNAEKAAARIYLGTDGTLGAQGGAPGVDITTLFGVASTRVEGDARAIERGLRTGFIEPWCAVNFGDSTLAPTRRYRLPDADANADRAANATRRQAFFADVAAARANGFEITQAFIDHLADEHGVTAPRLPAEANKAPSIAMAPTDIARVVTVNEARASAGVGPLMRADGSPDPDGRLTVEQFAAKKAAEATAAAPQASTPIG